MKKIVCILFAILAVACRGDDPVLPSTVLPVDPDSGVSGGIEGFFLLNEGNMGSNKASIDHYDYAAGSYARNIFGERNPDVVKGLGDVGNDIAIYDGRLWAVINCSNLVEVMDVRTARHQATIAIANCRYIAFNGDFAYVSSYAGPVQMGQNSRIGEVVKIDVRTLSIVGRCEVGYQPEEMAVVGTKLYVANSGGYRAPNYDRTVSVIDLGTFTEVAKIDVGINLHRMEVDRFGQLWVSSRGNNDNIPSRTYVIDTATDKVIDALDDLPNSRMALAGETLYVLSTQFSSSTEKWSVAYAAVDTRTRTVTSRRFITDGTDAAIEKPYGLAVHPSTGEILIGDARDYVSPGVLHCFGPDGRRRWSVTTGDIPAHIVFTTSKLLPLGSKPQPGAGQSPYVTKVFDFMPAPGQFTNQLPRWEEGDTRESINAKVLAAVGGGRGGMVSLGGWGGYIVVGFDHTIVNVAGKRDFRILGNAFDGGSEPGVVMVSRDENANGLPDDPWYELAGSAHDAEPESWLDHARQAGNDVELIRGYSLTYFRPDDPLAEVRWEDNRGESGVVRRVSFHPQPYYPRWAPPTITFTGTRLPQNAVDERQQGASDSYFVLYRFRRGYADNAPNDHDDSTFDIDWAVDSSGAPVSLPGVDFIRVHTGVNQQNGWIGECSTEFSGVTDLNNK